MSSFPVTVKKLAGRLHTVARHLDLEPDEVELFASIQGVRVPLLNTTFQVDDDGTLLFLGGFDGFLDELRAQVKEAEQNLVTECNRYNDLWLQFDQLRASSDRLCNELAVMCEAQLVGDHNLVMRKVEQFTDRYRENFKQAAANGGCTDEQRHKAEPVRRLPGRRAAGERQAPNGTSWWLPRPHELHSPSLWGAASTACGMGHFRRRLDLGPHG